MSENANQFMVVLLDLQHTFAMSPAAIRENPERKNKTLVLSACATRAMDLVGGLSEHHHSVSSATCFDEFKARCHQVTTVVMELMLPDVDGIEIIRYLGQQLNQPELIFVSQFDARIVAATQRLAQSKGLTVRASFGFDTPIEELAKAINAPPESTTARKKNPIVLTDSQQLRKGLVRDEFIVYFQPKIDVQTLELVSVEALVRWRHPEYGLLAPQSFVQLAEESGLINPLTDIIVDKAFTHAQSWCDFGIPLKVAINVSGASLADLTLPDRLLETAKRFALSPDQIVVEITESWIAKNAIDALDILTRLRMKGFNLSIDDFGTGYSSMLKLKQIPFSELKLDQSIIRGAANDPDARSIVETSIELGHKLGLHLVAEGVERQADWDLISELGCNEGQGFFIARPMKAKEIPDWHQRWNLSLGIQT